MASAATLWPCVADAGGSETIDKDPWLQSNPWGSFTATTRPPVAADSSEGLRQLETKVTQAVLSHLPSQSSAMERDDVPNKVQALEGQLQYLLSKQAQLEAHVHETATSQSNQLASMQCQINTQTQQLHGHMEAQQQNTAAMFESQMSQIRALMAKKPRAENE